MDPPHLAQRRLILLHVHVARAHRLSPIADVRLDALLDVVDDHVEQLLRVRRVRLYLVLLDRLPRGERLEVNLRAAPWLAEVGVVRCEVKRVPIRFTDELVRRGPRIHLAAIGVVGFDPSLVEFRGRSVSNGGAC